MRPWPLLVALAACKVKDPPPISTTEPWTDNFERTDPGRNYYKTGPGYAVDHAMNCKGAHNHPLWLRKKLPQNVRVEFDAWSNSPAGDIKIELFGDGHSYDPDAGAYTATGYEVIFGGWHNSKSIIARLDEHGQDMAARTDVKVVPQKHYHWKIERVGAKVSWWIDDMTTPFLVYDDPHPLDGPGHEFFAFNNWEADTWFDNLVITGLLTERD